MFSEHFCFFEAQSNKVKKAKNTHNTEDSPSMHRCPDAATQAPGSHQIPGLCSNLIAGLTRQRSSLYNSDFLPISLALLDPLNPPHHFPFVCLPETMCCVQTAGPHLDQWNICVVFSFHLLSLLLLDFFICSLITSHVLVFQSYEGVLDEAEWGKQFSSISGTLKNAETLIKSVEPLCVLKIHKGLAVNMRLVTF